MPWECGRKPEYWERAQVGPGRTYRLHTEFTLKISWIPAFLLNSISKDFQGENFHSSHCHCGPQTCTRTKDQLVFLTGPTCWGSSLVIRAGSKLRVVIYHAIYDDAHINFMLKKYDAMCSVPMHSQEQPKKNQTKLELLQQTPTKYEAAKYSLHSLFSRFASMRLHSVAQTEQSSIWHTGEAHKSARGQNGTSSEQSKNSSCVQNSPDVNKKTTWSKHEPNVNQIWLSGGVI